MINVLVISLPEALERQSIIRAHLQERDFEFHIFEAIDGRQMDVLAHKGYDAKTRRAAHGRDLKPGELGCLLSHRAAYQKIVDDNFDHALLLEDDARLAPETKDILEAFLAKNIDYDIIRLLGSEKVANSPHRKIIPLYKDFHLTRMKTTPGGAHATLISQAGAKKLLRATEKFAFPIDTILGRCWETSINAYSIQPGLAVQDMDMESSIGDARFEKKIELRGIEKLKFKVTRPLFKLSEAIGKHTQFNKTAKQDLALKQKFS